MVIDNYCDNLHYLQICIVVLLNNFRSAYLLQCVHVQNNTSQNIYLYVKLKYLATLIRMKLKAITYDSNDMLFTAVGGHR